MKKQCFGSRFWPPWPEGPGESYSLISLGGRWGLVEAVCLGAGPHGPSPVAQPGQHPEQALLVQSMEPAAPNDLPN